MIIVAPYDARADHQAAIAMLRARVAASATMIKIDVSAGHRLGEYKQQGPPFAELTWLLKEALPESIKLLIELHATADVDSVLAILRNAELLDRTTIAAGESHVLRRVKPPVRTCLVFPRRLRRATWLLKSMGTAAYMTGSGQDALYHQYIVDARLVQTVHRYHGMVYARAVTGGMLSRMNILGVDAVLMKDQGGLPGESCARQ